MVVESNNTSVEKINNISSLIAALSTNVHCIAFEDVMHVISENYDYTATSFTNGELLNETGTNEGSCKVFYFAKLNNLNEQQTLACFGRYYREDVLANPEGSDHGNIRNFIKTGWSGIQFNGVALK